MEKLFIGKYGGYMKTIQAERCSYCNSTNYYYPVNEQGREVLVVQCCRCGRNILVPGWEASYTSPEEASLNGIKVRGSLSQMEVVGSNQLVRETIQKTEARQENDPYLGLEPTSYLKIGKDGQLQQSWINRANGLRKWLPIPRE